MLKFHSDSYVTRPGYLLSINAFCKYSHSKVFRSGGGVHLMPFLQDRAPEFDQGARSQAVQSLRKPRWQRQRER